MGGLGNWSFSSLEECIKNFPENPNPKGPSGRNAGVTPTHQPHEVQGTWSTAAKKGITDLHTKSWTCCSYFRGAHLRVTISSLVCILGLFFPVIFLPWDSSPWKTHHFWGEDLNVQQFQVWLYSKSRSCIVNSIWLDEFMTLTSMWSSCLNKGKHVCLNRKWTWKHFSINRYMRIYIWNDPPKIPPRLKNSSCCSSFYSKVISTYVWNTPPNLCQQAIFLKEFLSYPYLRVCCYFLGFIWVVSINL